MPRSELFAESLSGFMSREIFRLEKRGVFVTVIGSGGKTSLIRRIAAGVSPKRTLITTTTKMFPPEGGAGFAHCAVAGRFAGSEKLEAFPPALMESAARGFDLVLAEGDGSRGLPLKAWADHEPVVPEMTGLTIGVIPVWPLGMAADERVIHRLPLFCGLTGVKKSERITLESLVSLVAGGGGKGLFSAARGRKMLFINQIEDGPAMIRAGELFSALPGDFLAGIDAVAAGSVQEDGVKVLTRREENYALVG